MLKLRGKGCADLRNQQQTGVGGAYRICRNVFTMKEADVSRLRGDDSGGKFN